MASDAPLVDLAHPGNYKRYIHSTVRPVIYRGGLVKSAGGEEEGADKSMMMGVVECSMCGDIGLRKKLFRCKTCYHRHQHTYCSNWYPQERSAYAGVCNWCADIKNRANNEEIIGQKQAEANVVDVDAHHHHVNITYLTSEPSKTKIVPYVEGHQLKKPKTRIAGGRRYKLVSEV